MSTNVAVGMDAPIHKDVTLNFRFRWNRKTTPIFMLISAIWLACSLALWWVASRQADGLAAPGQQPAFDTWSLEVSFAGVFIGMMIMFGASFQIASFLSKRLVRLANGDLTQTLYPVWCPVNSNVALAGDYISGRVRDQITALNQLLDEQRNIADQLLKLVRKTAEQTHDEAMVAEFNEATTRMIRIAGNVSRISGFFKLK